MRGHWLFGGAIAAAAIGALGVVLAAPRFADLPGKAAPG
jgi:hypothetical protein